MAEESRTSDIVRRWAWTVSQLRARAKRVKRRSGADEPPAPDGIVEEALELCNELLVDLAAVDSEARKLRDALQHEHQDAVDLFERIPIATVATDAAGLMTTANRHAALLLNVSARHLAGKPLLHFTHDRVAFLTLLRSLASAGNTAHGTISIRPRERRVMPVTLAVMPRTATNTTEWLWFLTPEDTTERYASGGRRDGSPANDSQVSA